MVKAQVHAGGRGKAGGVKAGQRHRELYAAPPPACWARALVTPQTGAEGLPVDKVYVETGSQIARELYLSLVLNREKSRSPSSPPRPAAWTSKKWPRTPRENHHGEHPSGGRASNT